MDVLGRTFKYFYPGEGEHQHEHKPEVPPVPVITPVIETGEKELVAPVIDHAQKIAHIEEQQARHQEDLFRQLNDLETRLQTATGSQVSSLEERIASLENRIAAQAKPIIPDESVELTLPDVETSPEPPEKIKQSLRHRRKARRKSS